MGRQLLLFSAFFQLSVRAATSRALAGLLLFLFQVEERSMDKPVILLAERNTELRNRLFCRLLCQGFDVITAANMSAVFRALRQRRDIGLFIISESLDEPGDGVDFAQLVRLHGYSPRVILTLPHCPEALTQSREPSSSAEYLLSSDDILERVYRFR